MFIVNCLHLDIHNMYKLFQMYVTLKLVILSKLIIFNICIINIRNNMDFNFAYIC